MERSTTEIELKTSGIKAHIYDYYLRGERKDIEAIMLTSAEFEDVDGKPKLKKVDATYRTRMEDKAVVLAIKKLVGKDGKEIEVTTENLDQLPNDDFIIIQDALPKKKATEEQTLKQ